MDFLEHLYISDSLKRKKNRIIKRLKANRSVPPIYLIVIVRDGINQMEIIPSLMFEQKYYQELDVLVIGIADSSADVQLFLEEIARKVYDSTSDANIKSYFLDR